MAPQVRSDACLSDDVLRAFALGDLPATEIDAVRIHLETCRDCEARIQALDDATDFVIDELRRSLRAGDALAAGSAVDPGPPALPDYEIDALPIGVGATGVVYKAVHRRLGRVVALKMVARRPDVVARLLELEAKAVAQLQHPNIVQIYDIGGDVEHPFLALEFVDGGSLEERLAESPPEPRRAAELIRVLAEAVDHAHRQGIVHCDLKPSNILLTRDGTPKIADFGMAKWTESDGYWGEEGGGRGTPRYMAPEQAGGSGSVGPATDVYSLGAILYEMLAGRPPHPAATAAETRRMVREDEPAPPSRVRPGAPRELDRIVLKCLRKHPVDRYPDARGLADDLDRRLAGASSGVLARRRGLRPAVLLVSILLAWIGVRYASVREAPSPTVSGPTPSAPAPSPSIVETIVQEDGTIRLGAAAAEVSGDSLKFEDSFGNLGYWHGPDDVATWTFGVEREATYRLFLEYANRNGEAGNQYELAVDGRRFVGDALGTDGWSHYRTFPIAEVSLQAGVHVIEVRPRAQPRGALFDLRAIVLGPVETPDGAD